MTILIGPVVEIMCVQGENVVKYKFNLNVYDTIERSHNFIEKKSLYLTSHAEPAWRWRAYDTLKNSSVGES